MPEEIIGRQSPDPETQSDEQKGPPSNAKGVDTSSNNKETSEKQLEELSSNPDGPMNQHVKETAKKTVGESK